MTSSIIQLFFSLGIPLILSTISSILPSEMSEEIKIKLFQSSLDTSIIFLRSQGFEATYDKLNADIYNDYIEIKNINIRKKFESSDFPFCDTSKIKMDSIWKDPACEFNMNIENIKFKGFNFKEGDDNFFEIVINNTSIDTSIFNDSSSKTTKKLFNIEETINLNFSTKNKYNFKKNIYENNLFLDVVNFGKLHFEVKLSNIIFDQEKVSAVMDAFIFKFIDNGILEKIDTFLDIEANTNLIQIINNNLTSKSILNIEDENKLKEIEEHNTLIDNVNRHYPNFNQNTKNLIEFIDNPISLKCIRDKDHIMNENLFETMEDLGTILVFAVFCENIIINDPN